MAENETYQALDFIREIVKADVESGKNDGRVHTRFPPEPNGYLHIGHAKAICLNFGLAEEYNGLTNLRFDDTNPTKEKDEYVEAIQDDIHWLGFDWAGRLYYASDYFDQLYEWAVELIKKGKAYVCDLTDEEMSEYRGANVFNEEGKRITPPGKNSPYRDRSVEENLDLFERMKNGEFPDGARTLRARIDMAHPNLIMRDPVMYRIMRKHHFRQGDKWLLYPTYDWTHGQSDSIEGITHSICDVSFEIHRPLYDWFLEALEIYHPRQYEFGRLNLTYTVLSKRYLRQLVEDGHVAGWDDPRLPTLRGMRRRGYTPEAIREFCRRIGISKSDGIVEIQNLEHCVREHLNKTAPRVMAVLDPIKVVITNYPEGQSEELDAINNPEDPNAGTRQVPFSRELYIERDDFMEDPPKKFFRLAPGREVRLRYAYFITCHEVVKNENGEIVELRCTYDPATRGGDAPDGRKVKATLHWVSAPHAARAEVRLYDYLFTREDPMNVPEGEDWKANLNPRSVVINREARLEPMLKDAEPGFRCQFERLGYFCKDPDSTPDTPVFNRTVALKDSWKKVQDKG
ncbi:MAG: glutamine--tRNA ligase/YqeY domain fusion protein [bacterium]|nr:glutamine--tRNA ligase/YqeY domain fusion protein [bacterium]